MEWNGKNKQYKNCILIVDLCLSYRKDDDILILSCVRNK